MIVTPSRLHPVRYMKEFKAYIKENQLKETFHGDDFNLLIVSVGGGELKHPEEFNSNVKPAEERNPLEEIIQHINELISYDFTPQDRVIVETLYRTFIEERNARIVNVGKN